MTRRRHGVLAAALLAASAVPSVAAEPPEPPTGAVVVARDGALWRVPVSDPTAVAKLADLPGDGLDVRAVVGSANGRLLLVDVNGVAGWVQPGDGDERTVAIARCVGPGRPAADGSRFVCPAGPATTLLHPVAWIGHEIDVAAGFVDFLGTTDELVVAADGQIRAVAVSPPHASRLLSPHSPATDLIVSPNGERAVGSYQDDDGSPAVYTFRLDGKAAKRKLGEEERPLGWSPDSRWVLLAHDKRACVVRAVGGEYKCWNRYRAVAISPDSRYVLLGRDDALYVAPIAGVESKRPKKLTDHAGPAAWIP